MPQLRKTHGRPWIVPPAITRGPAEGIERLGILAEHSEPQGLLLWHLARDVDLWASTPSRRRVDLFTPRADKRRRTRLTQSALPLHVEAAVNDLSALLAVRISTPSTAEVGAACEQIARWARAIGSRETAVAYAQAAALAAPTNAQSALLTGRCAEELGQHARASTWYQRAVALARRARDLPTYSAAFLALALQAEAEGRLEAARRRALRASRTARRAGKAGRTERARAAYLLFRLAQAVHADEASHRYARSCTRLALRGVELDAGTLLDLAEHWLPYRGSSMAGRLLHLLTTSYELTLSERFAAAVLRVRLEAGAGARLAACRALADALELAGEAVPEDGRAVAQLLQLASCAAKLGRQDLLARVSKLALTYAPAEHHAEVRAALGRLEHGTRLRGAA